MARYECAVGRAPQRSPWGLRGVVRLLHQHPRPLGVSRSVAVARGATVQQLQRGLDCIRVSCWPSTLPLADVPASPHATPYRHRVRCTTPSCKATKFTTFSSLILP